MRRFLGGGGGGVAFLAAVAAAAACSGGNATAVPDGGSSAGSSGAPTGTTSSSSSSGSVSSGSSPSSSGSAPSGSSSSGGAAMSGSSGGQDAASGAGALVTYGQPFSGGQYNLGPVDYAESQWHNACAPLTKYDPRVQQAEGTLLAGLWSGISGVAGDCDACIWVVTGAGKSAMLRVVTYGDTTTNSIDTSPDAFQLLDTGEYPRSMTWQFAKCPDTGPMMYEFQTGSSEWWTSFWVRNARVPITKVEVQSQNHSAWTALARGTDGTLTDAGGFGAGSFSIRSTGMDGQQVVHTFPWPSGGIAGAFLTATSNFD